MLYLNPPYYIIEGVSLLPDHADPLQWYFMPRAPKLTQIHDSKTGQEVPQIQLIKYRGSAGNGGFLNFDVNLGVEEELLDEIASELRNRLRLREMPRLAPVPLIDGNIKLLMLGKSSEKKKEDEDEKSNSELFEIKFSHNAKPSLYGNNQAAFSVALDQYSVSIIEKAIQGENAPIGVVYSLEYWGLRPAYSVRLSVDWNRVQNHMEESFSIDLVVYSSEINNVVDKLIEERIIQFEVDTFVPEGEAESGVIGRRDQAVKYVQGMITDAFFQPSLDPIKVEDDTSDKIVDTVQSLVFLNPGSCFSYKKIDITRIDQKKLDINFSERSTVRRSIYPQGHLSGLFRVLQNEDIKLDKFIIPVELDDNWFTKRKLRVISRANMVEDSILSISAQLHYGDENKTVILDANTQEQEISWNSILDENSGMVRDIKVQYKVTFTDVDGMERPITMFSEESVLDTDVWEINPREIYSLMTVPIIALNFPWERYPYVEIQLQYKDEDNNIRIEDSLLLDKDNTEKSWKVFVQDPLKTSFEYKIIYRAEDHKDVEKSWIEAVEERISLRDPFPNKRVLYVVPNISWDLVKEIFVDLIYEDKVNSIYLEETKQFSKESPSSEPFIVDMVNPDHRYIQFKVTLLFNDGRFYQVPPSMTIEPRIYIRQDMKGHRVITIQADESLKIKALKEFSVELKYEDEDNGLSFSDEYHFTSSEGKRNFEFDFVNPEKIKYDYRITYYYKNGMQRTEDWKSGDSNQLILSTS